MLLVARRSSAPPRLSLLLLLLLLADERRVPFCGSWDATQAAQSLHPFHLTNCKSPKSVVEKARRQKREVLVPVYTGRLMLDAVLMFGGTFDFDRKKRREKTGGTIFRGTPSV
jgi:hypothetical protein